jgi:hypothetical protein
MIGEADQRSLKEGSGEQRQHCDAEQRRAAANDPATYQEHWNNRECAEDAWRD